MNNNVVNSESLSTPVDNDSNSGLSLKDLISIIKKNILVILIFIVSFSVVGGVFSLIRDAQSPQYTANATMLVTIDNDSTNSNQMYQYSTNITGTVVSFIENNVVLNKVSVDNNTPLKTLKNNLEVSLKTNTLIIEINYTSSSSEESVKILNDILSSTVEMANSIEVVDGKDEEKYPILYKNISILNQASDETVTKTSRIMKYTLIFFALGVICACLYVLIKQLFDKTFKTNEEIEASLNVPVIANVPEWDNYLSNDKNKENANRYSYIVVKDEPTSVVSEAYRRVKVALQCFDSNEKVKVLQVCSSLKGEGKTTMILNIARTFSEDGKKVIVIDLDLRRPKLHRSFNVANDNGIVDVLIGDITLDKAIKHSDEFGFDILNRGQHSPNPSIVLGSSKLEQIIDSLKQEYDIVLVDCPPVLAVSDPIIVSKLTDGCLFVVSQKKTDKGAAKQAMKLLKMNGVNVLACVFTEISERNAYNHYYYYQSYYGKNKDGAKK